MKTMIRFGSMRQGRLDRVMKSVELIMEQLLSQTDMVLSLSKLRSIDDLYIRAFRQCVRDLPCHRHRIESGKGLVARTRHRRHFCMISERSEWTNGSSRSPAA